MSLMNESSILDEYDSNLNTPYGKIERNIKKIEENYESLNKGKE